MPNLSLNARCVSGCLIDPKEYPVRYILLSSTAVKWRHCIIISPGKLTSDFSLFIWQKMKDMIMITKNFYHVTNSVWRLPTKVLNVDRWRRGPPIRVYYIHNAVWELKTWIKMTYITFRIKTLFFSFPFRLDACLFQNMFSLEI